MGAGRALALKGYGGAGDGLEIYVFVCTVLAGSYGSVFNRHERPGGHHRPHDRRVDLRDKALLRKHHRGIGEAAGRISGGYGAVLLRYLSDICP